MTKLHLTVAHLFADEDARERTRRRMAKSMRYRIYRVSDGETLALAPNETKAQELCEALGERARYE